MSANKTGPDALRPLLLAFEPVFFMITLMKLGVFINAILFHYNFSLITLSVPGFPYKPSLQQRKNLPYILK